MQDKIREFKTLWESYGLILRSKKQEQSFGAKCEIKSIYMDDIYLCEYDPYEVDEMLKAIKLEIDKRQIDEIVGNHE